MSIFVSDNLFSDENKSLLEGSIPNEIFHYHPTNDFNSSPHPDFLSSDICFGNIPPQWIPVNNKLKWIQLISVGFGEYLGLDWKQLSGRLMMTNLSGFFARAVSQSILAGILSLYRKIDELIILKKSGIWKGYPLRESMKTLDNKIVILFGNGSINRNLSEILSPFNCKIKVFDSKGKLNNLDKAIPKADIIVSVVPDTPDTKYIFNKTRLKSMNKGAVFVNFGRGSVVDEEALADSLCGDQIGGAVIDVTNQEPLSNNHRFWNCPNLILTQHTGGGTIDEMERKIKHFVENYSLFKEGKKLNGLVNFKKGY